jgi:hypothetical protein
MRTILFLIIFIPIGLLSLLPAEQGEMWAGDDDEDEEEEDGCMPGAYGASRTTGVTAVPATKSALFGVSGMPWNVRSSV